jgi:hypothetical protein
MTADSTVAEIETSGGTALGIEVDVIDHEAVTAIRPIDERDGTAIGRNPGVFN